MWVPISTSWIKTFDADGWELKTGGNKINSATCAGIPIIGGPGNFGSNT
mgnify:CR=1 FL=1